MNPLDIIIVATMGFFIVRGIFRGFIKEIASLAGVVLGIWLAIRLQPQVADYLKPYLPSTQFLGLISFAAIFFLVLLFCNLFGWTLKLLFKKGFLGWADRTLGAGLAATKGLVITYLGIVLLTFFLPSGAPIMARSKLAPLIIASYQTLISLVSPDVYQNWKEKFTGDSEGMGEIVKKGVERITGKDD